MWILTGMLLGSIIASTHDNEETCRGRMAMLGKEKNVQNLDCKPLTVTTFSSGTTLRSMCSVVTLDGKCAN